MIRVLDTGHGKRPVAQHVHNIVSFYAYLTDILSVTTTANNRVLEKSAGDQRSVSPSVT